MKFYETDAALAVNERFGAKTVVAEPAGRERKPMEAWIPAGALARSAGEIWVGNGNQSLNPAVIKMAAPDRNGHQSFSVRCSRTYSSNIRHRGPFESVDEALEAAIELYRAIREKRA